MNPKRICVLMLCFIVLLSTLGCDRKAVDEISNPDTAAAESLAASEEYIVHQGYYFEDSGWIYYCNPDDGYSLYKKSLNSSDNIKIMDRDVRPFCLDGDWIYYSEVYDNFSLYRIKTDSSIREKLNNDGSSSINVGREWIYYGNSSEGDKIYKIKKDGTGRTKLVDEAAWSVYVAEGDGIYYINPRDSNSIYRIEMDGSKKTKITNGASHLFSVSEGWVYYVLYETSQVNYPQIYKIRKDGTGNTLLAKGKPNEYLANFKVFGDYIYYHTYNSDYALYRIKIDGTEQERISIEGEHIDSMNISKDGLLFKSTQYDTILCKMDMNSNNETIIVKPPVYDTRHLSEWLLYKDINKKLGLNADKADSLDYNEPFVGCTSEVKLLGATVYFLVKSGDSSSLYKLNANNPKPKLIAEGKIISYDIAGDIIYYSDSSNHTIYSIKTDGAGKKEVAKKGADYILVRGDCIYSTYNNHGIYRMKTNGTDGGFLVNSSWMSSTFAIYDDWIYYPEGSGLFRIKTDGTKNTKLFDIEGGIHKIISIKDDRVYYESNISNVGAYYDWISGFYSVKLDGTDKQTLVEGTINSLVVVDSIYYSKIIRNINIIKAKHDGTERKIVVPDLKWNNS